MVSDLKFIMMFRKRMPSRRDKLRNLRSRHKHQKVARQELQLQRKNQCVEVYNC
jgi:hypothetical protein